MKNKRSGSVDVNKAISESLGDGGSAVRVFLDRDGIKVLLSRAASSESLGGGAVSVLGNGWHVIGIATGRFRLP